MNNGKEPPKGGYARYSCFKFSRWLERKKASTDFIYKTRYDKPEWGLSGVNTTGAGKNLKSK